MTFVLVITGKGKPGSAEQERGVLRRQVPHWLSQPTSASLVARLDSSEGFEILSSVRVGLALPEYSGNFRLS